MASDPFSFEKTTHSRRAMRSKKWDRGGAPVMGGFSARLMNHKPALSGMVVDLRPTDDGAVAVVDFSSSTEPCLRIADHVEIEISGGEFKTPLAVSARVLLRSKDEVRHRLELQLDNETRMILMPPVSRRQAFRVRPAATKPIDAALKTTMGRKLASVVLHDISIGGVSLLVTHEDEFQLSPQWEFLLTIQLPEAKEPIDFVCAVRQRRLVGSQIAYGMEFDAVATQLFGRKQELVRAYVMQRQREILRAKRGTG